MNTRPGISLFCCYNNQKEAESMLLDSLERIADKIPFALDVHMIDTRAKGYTSAAEAYNTEVGKLENSLKDILIFCHQDISFPDETLLLRIYAELKADSNQILGVAGMASEGTPRSNLKYKSDQSYITRCQVTDKTPVVSLDECLIALDRNVFLSIKFDQKMLSHWHLYAVDLCYNARYNHGIESFVLPETVYHKYSADSGQQTDNVFLREINHVAKKYKDKVDVIRTPCYILSTSFLSRWVQLSRTSLKHLM